MIDPVLVTRKISLIAGDLKAVEQKALQDIPRFLRYADDFVDRQPPE